MQDSGFHFSYWSLFSWHIFQINCLNYPELFSHSWLYKVNWWRGGFTQFFLFTVLIFFRLFIFFFLLRYFYLWVSILNLFFLFKLLHVIILEIFMDHFWLFLLCFNQRVTILISHCLFRLKLVVSLEAVIALFRFFLSCGISRL